MNAWDVFAVLLLPCLTVLYMARNDMMHNITLRQELSEQMSERYKAKLEVECLKEQANKMQMTIAALDGALQEEKKRVAYLTIPQPKTKKGRTA